MREWRNSLVVIAQKTPPLVQEATNYLESDLEFNSVLRRGNSDQVRYILTFYFVK